MWLLNVVTPASQSLPTGGSFGVDAKALIETSRACRLA